MSVSLNANVVDRVTVSATPDVATEVILHKDVRTVSIEGYDAAGTVTAACKLALTGTDNTAIGSDFKTIDAGALLRHAVSGRGRNLAGTSIFVASAVAGAIIEVTTSNVPVS